MNPYDFAILMSHDGETFFRTLGKKVKKPGLRKILVILASDQAIQGNRARCAMRQESSRSDQGVQH